jgi:Fe-S cluster assembly ATP-binding protein
MLSITNLHVPVGDKPILKRLTLEVSAGEANAIRGRTGRGYAMLASEEDSDEGLHRDDR